MGLSRTERAERTERTERTEAERVALGAAEGLLQGDTVRWQLWIDETPRPGWANMAIDLALLDCAEQRNQSWLRLYQWDPHCLSFGRHEPATRRYDIDRIRALGLDSVRRPTGGRAVWHARELTYAVASPFARFGSLSAAYLEVHRLLGDAFAELGIETTLAPRTRTGALDAGACFSQPVGGELLVSGRKVVGSAQLRRGTALLQHGSILLQDDQALVKGVMRGSAGNAPSFSALPPDPPLVDDLRRPLSAQVTAVAVAQAARHRWPGAWEQVAQPRHILRAASRHYPHFRSSTWTWAR
jgi:lipoate-protein ligase A